MWTCNRFETKSLRISYKEKEEKPPTIIRGQLEKRIDGKGGR